MKPILIVTQSLERPLLRRALLAAALLAMGARGDALSQDGPPSVEAPGTPTAQPDLLIKKGDEPNSSYAIDNTYQSAPSGAQVERLTVVPGEFAIYDVRVQNDSAYAYSYVVKAIDPSVTGWTVSYHVGTTDITADLRGRGYVTPTLAPSEWRIITVKVRPTGTAVAGSVQHVTLRAYRGSTDTTVRDAVGSATTLASG